MVDHKDQELLTLSQSDRCVKHTCRRAKCSLVLVLVQVLDLVLLGQTDPEHEEPSGLGCCL